MNQERLNQLHQFLEQNPEDSFVLYAIAHEYHNINELVLAQEYYERLRKLDPNYLGLYYALGKLYRQLGQDSRAIEVYQAGIALAEAKQETHLLAELKNALTNTELGLDLD